MIFGKSNKKELQVWKEKAVAPCSPGDYHDKIGHICTDIGPQQLPRPLQGTRPRVKDHLLGLTSNFLVIKHH